MVEMVETDIVWEGVGTNPENNIEAIIEGIDSKDVPENNNLVVGKRA